jgi:hypothetical protein
MDLDPFGLQKCRQEVAALLERAAVDSGVLDALRFGKAVVPKECELWDYKRELPGSREAVLRTLPRIVAFHNTYGGYLLFGIEEVVRDLEFRVVGIVPGAFPLRQLSDLLREYTGDLIDITYREISCDLLPLTRRLGILHVPKRRPGIKPVQFGRNGPSENGRLAFQKDEVYLRRLQECVPADGLPDYELLLSSRANPFLWSVSEPASFSRRGGIVADHNLPDRNLICPKLLGREDVLKELWRWLGDEFVNFKVLAGDGGKGKTSVAYHFAESVCRNRPNEIETVIWLTAKARRFVAASNDYAPMPSVDFSDAESLLHAIASSLPIRADEIADASTHLLKRHIQQAFRTLRCLVIIDDVDSTELSEQKRILDIAMQLARPEARFVLTTRLDLALASEAVIRISGLDRGEYIELVETLTANLKLPPIRAKMVDTLRQVTDGSPLFTESLLRLMRSGLALDRAITQWKGKLGSEVREAALRREVDSLSAEARLLLYSCACLREASLGELRQVTGYNEERMNQTLSELERLYLLTAPRFSAGEPRFGVTENTRRLVVEHAGDLVRDPSAVERKVNQLRTRGQREAQRLQRGALAISQADVLLKDGRFDEALATVDAAIRQEKGHRDLLLCRGRVLLEQHRREGDRRLLDAARHAFDSAWKGGCRKEILFGLWYEAEMAAHHPSGAIEAAGAALDEGAHTRSLWLRRRAAALLQLSRDHESARNPLAARDEMIGAASDLEAAIGLVHRDEIGAFRLLLDQVNDDVWRLTRSAADDLPGFRLAFDWAKRAVQRGDRRGVAFIRVIEAAEEVLQVIASRERTTASLGNIAGQTTREASEAVRLARSAGFDESAAKTLNERLAALQARAAGIRAEA